MQNGKQNSDILWSRHNADFLRRMRAGEMLTGICLLVNFPPRQCVLKNKRDLERHYRNLPDRRSELWAFHFLRNRGGTYGVH